MSGDVHRDAAEPVPNAGEEEEALGQGPIAGEGEEAVDQGPNADERRDGRGAALSRRCGGGSC
jgi:hypothetical protein